MDRESGECGLTYVGLNQHSKTRPDCAFTHVQLEFDAWLVAGSIRELFFHLKLSLAVIVKTRASPFLYHLCCASRKETSKALGTPLGPLSSRLLFLPLAPLPLWLNLGLHLLLVPWCFTVPYLFSLAFHLKFRSFRLPFTCEANVASQDPRLMWRVRYVKFFYLVFQLFKHQFLSCLFPEGWEE